MSTGDPDKVDYRVLFSWLMLFTFIIVFSVGAFGQRRGATAKKKHYGRIDMNKPTLYLAFVSTQIIKDKKGMDDKENKYKLTLHNNTSWAIYYYIALEDNKAAHPTMIYDVESKEKNIIYRFSSWAYHVSTDAFTKR